MIRPLREIMTERDHYIQLVQRDTLDARKQLEAVVAASREEEYDIRQTAFRIVAEMEDLGNQEAKDLVGVARDEIAAQKRQSHAEIEGHLSEAMTAVQDEAQALSVSIMEKVLNRKVAT